MSQSSEGKPAMAVDRIDASALRREFPVLDQKVHGKPLVYLDSAASCQKPESVIEGVDADTVIHQILATVEVPRA